METTKTETKADRMNAALGEINDNAGYQRNIILGRQALSGADLAGKARKYGSKYFLSRAKAIDIAQAYGAHIRRGAHGRLVLEWGDVPEGARRVSCALGEAWAY